jgi:YgiT-type zinc finger domain-containing protein
MMTFDKCPICGGELVEKEVEKLLRGGIHMAVLSVHAEVCLRCGERLYSQETVRWFEQIRAKLEHQEVAGFQPLGQSFRSRKAWLFTLFTSHAAQAGPERPSSVTHSDN